MPLDHFAPGTATTKVGFAIRRHTAPGPARGVLVTLTGGAGAGGIAAADATTAELGLTIRARWDLVFVDPRGVGRSGAFDCPKAALAWHTADASAAGAGSAGAPAGTDADLVAAAARFSTDCVKEAGVDPGTLRFYGSRDMAADLEALRIYLGAEQWTLNGEAEGGTIAQAYAEAHPEHVDGLILDAPADPSMSAADAWLESTRANDQTLSAALLDCTTAVSCTRDVRGGDALAAYDALARTLAAGPVTVNVPGADGKDRETAFTLTDLGAVAAAYIGDETDRMLLQRAVAAASQDRWWLLTRMRGLAVGENPETGRPLRDPTRSDALAVAWRCADRELLPGSADPATDWLALGRANGTTATRLGQGFATDLPCATWPGSRTGGKLPAGVTDATFPVIVLGATLDPVAPWANGERIAARAGDKQSHTIVTAGGSHITYGRGGTCPDRFINTFLVVDKEPPARTTCSGSVADAYVPLGAATRSGVKGTKAALADADREIVNAPDRIAWTGAGELRFGCPNGGWIAYVQGTGQTDLTLQSCAWTKGVPLTGTGIIADDNGALHLTLDGGAGAGTVSYARSGKGEVSVSGTLSVLH